MNPLFFSPSRARQSAARRVAARCLAAACLYGAALGAAGAQPAALWNRMELPLYPASQQEKLKVDSDEYEIHLRTSAEVQQVFDFYRDRLEQQNFRVTSSKTKKHGLKAYLQRGQGTAPEDLLELDVKRKGNGLIKVEIETGETD